MLFHYNDKLQVPVFWVVTLKVEAAWFSEMLVSCYITWFYSPETMT
jgi:hypothetical protein